MNVPTSAGATAVVRRGGCRHIRSGHFFGADVDLGPWTQDTPEIICSYMVGGGGGGSGIGVP